MQHALFCRRNGVVYPAERPFTALGSSGDVEFRIYHERRADGQDWLMVEVSAEHGFVIDAKRLGSFESAAVEGLTRLADLARRRLRAALEAQNALGAMSQAALCAAPGAGHA